MAAASKGVRTVLSHGEFYRVCEFIRRNKERLLTERPDDVTLAAQITATVGFPVTQFGVKSARKATGVRWFAKRPNQAGNGHHTVATKAAIRILTRAVYNLYAKLGDTMPNGLQKLYHDSLLAATTAEAKAILAGTSEFGNSTGSDDFFSGVEGV